MLAERLLEGRNRIRHEIGPQWQLALGVSLARWLFEYGVLLLALCGLSAEPDPALVLLAFVVASVLGLLPFTPGGLGFVEAGLAATLAVAGHLHRRRAGRDARLPPAHVLVAHPARRDRGAVVPDAATRATPGSPRRCLLQAT